MSIFKWMTTASLMACMMFATVGCETETQDPPVEQTESPDIEMPAADSDVDAPPADEPAVDVDVDANEPVDE